MCPRKNRAFTLVEVLLALGLTAVLCGMMFGIYRSSAQGRREVQQKLEDLRIMRVVTDQIARDLASAVSLEQLQIGLVGESDWAEWVCVDLPARRAWAEAQLGDQRPTPEADLRMVGYRLRTEETTGEESPIGIERTFERIVTSESTSRPSRTGEGMGESAYESATRRQEEERAAEEGEDADNEEERVEVKLLSGAIRYLRFRYFDGQEWLDEWEDAAKVPVAVELSLGFKPAPSALLESDDVYPYKVFRRVVYLAAAAKPQQEGTQVKGLGGSR